MKCKELLLILHCPDICSGRRERGRRTRGRGRGGKGREKGETGVKLEGESGGKNPKKRESGEMAGCEKNDKRTIKRR